MQCKIPSISASVHFREDGHHRIMQGGMIWVVALAILSKRKTETINLVFALERELLT
jgi:hypothetical protein